MQTPSDEDLGGGETSNELVIRNELVVDGTGRKPFRSDVAINKSLITEIGLVTSKGNRE